MIPKIIHYCWFGGGKMSPLMEKCKKSWTKYCRDYEIIEWNESNTDIQSMPQYVQQAFSAKKWAFVSDYVRLWAVYTFGGIYLDTDVQLIKPIDSLLGYRGFFGFEGKDKKVIATGLGFGGERGLPLLLELMESYTNFAFTEPNQPDSFMPNTWINWPVFQKHGVKNDDTFQLIDNDIAVFPCDYFDPMQDYLRTKIVITKNTYSIHHYTMSWSEDHERKIKNLRRAEQLTAFKRFLRSILGANKYEKIKRIIKHN